MPSRKVSRSRRPPVILSDELYRDPDWFGGWLFFFSGSCEICCKSKNAAHENGALACCSEYSHTERPCLNHKKITLSPLFALRVV